MDVNIRTLGKLIVQLHCGVPAFPSIERYDLSINDDFPRTSSVKPSCLDHL